MKAVLKLEGLDCAVCAGELEELIKELDGVMAATVAFAAATLTVEYEDEETLKKVKATANAFEEVRVVEEEAEETKGSKKKEWLRILFSACLLVGGVLSERLGNSIAWTVLGYVLYVGGYLLVGYDVILSVFKKKNIFDENFLMTVASVGAFALGEALEGVAVMLLYQLGELLQGIAVGASRKSVTKLMDLKTTTATRIAAGGESETVAPEALHIGDVVLVKAGEKIPCDGVLLDELAVLDTKSLTGEAEPKNVKREEELLSGFINVGGVFTMRITRAYEDSAVKKILDLMENSAAKKAAPEKFITKFARYYTPAVCIFALLFAGIAPLVSYFATGNAEMIRYVRSALTFLVVSCPCALVISVPLTYFSALGTCARKGVLVKGATCLEAAAAVKTLAFDKTGTLTEGNFEICETVEVNASKEELLAIAAALEENSAHPLAKAFSGVPFKSKAKGVVETMGKGVCGELGGEVVRIGSAVYLKENGVSVQEIDSVYTVLYIARGREYLGATLVGDKLRTDCKATLKGLKEMGYFRTVMLTGDSEKRAKFVAEEVGIEEVRFGLLPDEKLRCAEELKTEGKLLYVGDGINDAPVMAAADLAVSMGKLGSAAAVEASDFVLVSDNLSALPQLFKVAKKTRSIVRQNVVFSIVMKAVFMLLGGMGVLPLALAVFADVGVMLLAVLNSLRVNA
ncbi:MAG: cadmium-translocating P-type ATPase [Clostridia bacterium]|nr:cadmium-translocating P-type ATPase [Clostridia bacterium]